jgi:hypothetical protein
MAFLRRLGVFELRRFQLSRVFFLLQNVQHQPRFTRKARSISPENCLITFQLSTQSAGESSVCMVG